jgi:hypothetical protein
MQVNIYIYDTCALNAYIGEDQIYISWLYIGRKKFVKARSYADMMQRNDIPFYPASIYVIQQGDTD